jgi:arsenate reductase
MDKKRVLFICVHNSARSQMAQAFANREHGDALEANSAGLEPTALNPLAVEVMAEAGLDISAQKASSVFERYKAGETYDYVITVCAGAETKCPVFPGIARRLHWPFDDPEALDGDREHRLEGARRIRDAVRRAVAGLAAEARGAGA